MCGLVSATTIVCFCVPTSCHPGCHIFRQLLGPESRAAASIRFEQVQHNLMRTKPPHTSLSATLSFIVLESILPCINSRPVSYDNHDMATENLTIPRASILLLVIGFVGIALSPHIVVLALAIMVYALDVGYSGAIRCLVNPPRVERDQVGRP